MTSFLSLTKRNMTCEQRCRSLYREVPSYSMIENIEPSDLYPHCVEMDKKMDCSFPITVKYSFEKNLWIGKNYWRNFHEYHYIMSCNLWHHIKNLSPFRWKWKSRQLTMESSNIYSGNGVSRKGTTNDSHFRFETSELCSIKCFWMRWLYMVLYRAFRVALKQNH